MQVPMMKRRDRVLSRQLWWLTCSFLVACGGGGGCGGCACLQKIPGGYEGRKMDNAIAARVTDDGFTFLSQHFSALLTQAGVANPMQLPVACSAQSGGHFCDQNRNGQCDPGEQCNATVTINDFALHPADPTVASTGVIQGTMHLQIATGTMWFFKPCALKACLFGSCACICDLACSADFQSTRSGAPTETFSAEVTFTIDLWWGRILAFDVGNVGGINNLESNDLNIGASGVCGSLTCGLLDVSFIKNIVVDQFLKPQLMNQVRQTLDAARCRACSAADPCPAGATCSGGKCMAGGRCLPVTLGLEGRADLAQVVPTLPMAGAVDLYAVAGGSVSSAAGAHFTAAVLGGGEPFTGTGDGGVPLRGPALCVPGAAPPPGGIPEPNWAAVDGGYHLGLAVAGKWIDQVMWATHQAGGMCIDVGSEQVGLLTTGLFKSFLPSLGPLATRDGKDAPMLFAIRPSTPPTVTIGAGTFDPLTKKPLEPLLELSWTDLDIDVYAMLDDRYVRLFRLVTDVKVPLSLVFEGCDKVTPALGDIRQLLTHVRAVESEMLAEDPQVLADLIPTFLTLAESSLAGGLGSQTLPSLGAFRLQVTDARGITGIPGTQHFEHIGIFAKLLDPNGTCTAKAPSMKARLKRAEIPPAAALRASGQGLPWPVAVLDVAAEGDPWGVEFAFRADHGLWSTFRPAPDGELTVTSPLFLLQGRHDLEVRARRADQPHGVSAPVPVAFVVDFEPPSLSLRADAELGQLRVRAHDQVSADAALLYAYQVGDGPSSDFGPPQPLLLSALQEQGGLVFVKDEAGQVAQAAWRVPTVATRPESPLVQQAPRGGCSSLSGEGSGLLALLVLSLRRRRSVAG